MLELKVGCDIAHSGWWKPRSSSSQKHSMIDEYSQISSTKATNCKKLTFSLSHTDIVRGKSKCWDKYWSSNKGWEWQSLFTPQKTDGWECHLHLGKGEKIWEKNDQIDKDSDKKRRTEILTASYERACVCVCACRCVCACACPCWSWLGHPTLFNVTLTSKPCVQALNADRMEQVFI